MPKIDPEAIELGHALVASIAPKETELYYELVESYRGPESEKRRGSDHPLAFGLGELVTVATPFLYECCCDRDSISMACTRFG
jgi:hypothetical protein